MYKLNKKLWQPFIKMMDDMNIKINDDLKEVFNGDIFNI